MNEAPRSIPVILGKARAGTPDNFIGRPPVVAVHVTPDLSDAPKHNGRLYHALIDTGAECTAVGAHVAAEIGVQPSGTAIVHGLDGMHPEVQGAKVQVIFPVADLAFATRAPILDFRSGGQTFDLILGRSFLRNCRLLLDGPRQQYEIVWVGPPKTVPTST
jgi:hypothetical protein